jgi:hypothetical protein
LALILSRLDRWYWKRAVEKWEDPGEVAKIHWGDLGLQLGETELRLEGTAHQGGWGLQWEE